MSMSIHKMTVENFSKALNDALKNRFGRIPSASKLALEFNCRAFKTKNITNETARKWMRGKALPKTTSLQTLIEWLVIDPVNIFSADGIVNLSQGTTSITDSLAEVNKKLALVRDEHLAISAIDFVSPKIAVIDCKGKILMVNHAWRAKSYMDGSLASKDLCEGVNYLDMCDKVYGPDAIFSSAMSSAIRSIILNECFIPLPIKYPCHLPNEKRWFNAKVISYIQDNNRCIVISHEPITEDEFND